MPIWRRAWVWGAVVAIVAGVAIGVLATRHDTVKPKSAVLGKCVNLVGSGSSYFRVVSCGGQHDGKIIGVGPTRKSCPKGTDVVVPYSEDGPGPHTACIDQDNEGPVPSKTQYLTKLLASCHTATRQLAALPPPAQGDATAELAYTLQLLDLNRRLADDVHKLTPPTGDEAAIAKIVATQDQTVKSLEARRDALQAHDAAAASAALTTAQTAAKDAGSLWFAYGAVDCSTPLVPQ
jgi:hypothetical protein